MMTHALIRLVIQNKVCQKKLCIPINVLFGCTMKKEVFGVFSTQTQMMMLTGFAIKFWWIHTQNKKINFFVYQRSSTFQGIRKLQKKTWKGKMCIE